MASRGLANSDHKQIPGSGANLDTVSPGDTANVCCKDPMEPEPAIPVVDGTSKGRTCHTNETITPSTPPLDLVFPLPMFGRAGYGIESGRDAATGGIRGRETAFDNHKRIVKVIFWPEGSQGSESSVSEKREQSEEKVSLTDDGKHTPSSACSIESIPKFTRLDHPNPRTLHGSVEPLRLQQVCTCNKKASGENVADNLLSKKGIPNNFDLSRLVEQGRQREQANMGAIPFMALNLLSEEGLDGRIPRHYCHEAEAFAWVLIYICGTADEHEGRIVTTTPNPFEHWLSSHRRTCRYDKLDLAGTIDGLSLPVHGRTRRLLADLYGLWDQRHNAQQNSGGQEEGNAVAPEFAFEGIKDTGKPPLWPYRESSDIQAFANVVAIIGKTLEANTPEYNHAVELVKRTKESGIGLV